MSGAADILAAACTCLLQAGSLSIEDKDVPAFTRGKEVAAELVSTLRAGGAPEHLLHMIAGFTAREGEPAIRGFFGEIQQVLARSTEPA